jgi:tRNA(Ile)-lysidine synthase
MGRKSTSTLAQRVLETMLRNHMFDNVTKAIIAFSAGPDSVCLLDVLHDLLSKQLEFELVYVNHGLRSTRALDREERMTREYSQQYGLRSKILRINVSKQKEGVEGTARILRYRALNAYAKRVGASRIVLGHNLDDVVETLLLNIIRGSGMRGLRSIPAVRTPFVRPLIDVKKSDILNYLKMRKLSYAQDATNRSLDLRRNVLRLKVIPLLEKMNPEIHEAIRKEVEILKQDDEYIEQQAAKAYEKVSDRAQSGVLLDLNTILGYNQAIVSRVVMKAIQELRGNLDGYASKHYHAIISLNSKEHGKRINLPKGLCAQREKDKIVIGFVSPRRQFKVPLDIKKGECLAGDYRVRAKVFQSWNFQKAGGNCEVFDLDRITLPLYVRSRRLGDIIETTIGRKMVKKIYSEHRIEPRDRDRAAMLCDQKGILWILGIARAFRGFVSSKTKRFLVVDFEHID